VLDEVPEEEPEEELEPTIYFANDLTEGVCEATSLQNFYDATTAVCNQCPEYYIADRTVLDCIQNTCDVEAEYLDVTGECVRCDG